MLSNWNYDVYASAIMDERRREAAAYRMAKSVNTKQRTQGALSKLMNLLRGHAVPVHPARHSTATS